MRPSTPSMKVTTGYPTMRPSTPSGVGSYPFGQSKNPGLFMSPGASGKLSSPQKLPDVKKLPFWLVRWNYLICSLGLRVKIWRSRARNLQTSSQSLSSKVRKGMTYFPDLEAGHNQMLQPEAQITRKLLLLNPIQLKRSQGVTNL